MAFKKLWNRCKVTYLIITTNFTCSSLSLPWVSFSTTTQLIDTILNGIERLSVDKDHNIPRSIVTNVRCGFVSLNVSK
jgi:hypothetical protein